MKNQTKNLEHKVRCDKRVIQGQFELCSDHPSERQCQYQGPSIISLGKEKPVSTYFCQREY